MSKIFEKPDGVFRSEGKVIRVTQQAIDNAQSFYDILGDATEIGNEAFMNLDLSKWNSPKSPVIVTSYKRPIKRGSSFDASYYPSVKTQADIRIPQGIQKVGARAFKGVKGIEVLEVGNRTFNK